MIYATRSFDLLATTEQEDVAQNANDEDSAGYQEVRRERAGSVKDKSGHNRGHNSCHVVEEVHDAADWRLIDFLYYIVKLYLTDAELIHRAG